MTTNRRKVILLVERDSLVEDSINRFLKRENFITISTTSLKSTENKYLEFSPDLILIDFDTICRWDIDCLDLFSNLKRTNHKCKLILGYSVSTENSLKRYFESGIDDCIKKPFSNTELLVRILNNLSLINTNSFIEYRGLKLYTKKRYITINNIKTFLSKKETLLMKILLESREIVPLEQISDFFKSNDNTSRMSINRLRKKIIENTGLDIIKCRYGVGYYIAI